MLLAEAAIAAGEEEKGSGTVVTDGSATMRVNKC